MHTVDVATPDQDEDAKVEAVVRSLASQGGQSWLRKRRPLPFGRPYRRHRAEQSLAEANAAGAVDLTESDREPGPAQKKARVS